MVVDADNVVVKLVKGFIVLGENVLGIIEDNGELANDDVVIGADVEEVKVEGRVGDTVAKDEVI